MPDISPAAASLHTAVAAALHADVPDPGISDEDRLILLTRPGRAGRSGRAGLQRHLSRIGAVTLGSRGAGDTLGIYAAATSAQWLTLPAICDPGVTFTPSGPELALTVEHPGTHLSSPGAGGLLMWTATLHPDPNLSTATSRVPAGPQLLDRFQATVTAVGGRVEASYIRSGGGLTYIPVELPAGRAGQTADVVLSRFNGVRSLRRVAVIGLR